MKVKINTQLPDYIWCFFKPVIFNQGINTINKQTKMCPIYLNTY